MPTTDAHIFTLYLGNRDAQPFSDADEAAIFETVGQSFPSFTALEARGIYEGRSTPTLLIQIASDERDRVTELARNLGRKFGQRWVGVSDGARYTSIPSVQM